MLVACNWLLLLTMIQPEEALATVVEIATILIYVTYVTRICIRMGVGSEKNNTRDTLWTLLKGVALILLMVLWASVGFVVLKEPLSGWKKLGPALVGVVTTGVNIQADVVTKHEDIGKVVMGQADVAAVVMDNATVFAHQASKKSLLLDPEMGELNIEPKAE